MATTAGGFASAGGADTVALAEGSSFCLARPSGDVSASADGFYVRDTRLLSQLRVSVNGSPLDALSWHKAGPASATFVSRVPSAEPATESTLVVVRTRHLGHGLRDDIVVRNLADEPAYCELEVVVAADLAEVAAVHGDAAPTRRELVTEAGPEGMRITSGRGDQRTGCHIVWTGEPHVGIDTLAYEAIVPARGTWSISVLVAPVLDGEELAPRFRLEEPIERTEPTDRLDRWRRTVPIVDTDHAPLALALSAGADDLGSLRVLDPEYPERAVVLAGSPWYLSLVGRDALITSWMALIVDPDLALGTLETLARFQGQEVDERTEEEPGRILHRMRIGPAAFGPDSGALSYSSVDATPLFVMLLGELRRWGLAPELVDRLLPHADRALEWIESFGDRDGDGFVEYQRATDRGITHQGWKDGPDGVRHVDGRVAVAPVALAEVQGYVYSAYLARSHFATEAGDQKTADRFRRKAADLKTAFNRAFWVDERGWLAMGLDADKHHIDALASNMGHCLWTGILDEDKAEIVAKHLLSPELFTGWGVRTLASGMRGYNPVGLHTGAVWPHDSALCAAGLMRYGFVDEAHRIMSAMLDAAALADGRLTQLCGFDRDELPGPVPFPEVCTTRAWAAASGLSLLRTMLRFEPWIPYGKLWLAPSLPEPVRRLHVVRIPLLGGRVSVHIDGDRVEVEDLPPGVEVVTEPRRPLTAAVP